MQSAKSIISKIFNMLEIRKTSTGLLLLGVVFIGSFIPADAQDNSPYSRYGIGTLSPSTNILNRGMGSLSAAYRDPLTINFNNPASYSSFLSYAEQKAKKSFSSRVILDAGMNFGSRTLREGNSAEKFSSADGYFSYIQVGIPLKQNWGLSFGIRPVSRIYYKMSRREYLNDPLTNLPIDSAFTEFNGDGGAFLPTIGTGFAIKNFSAGVNIGYMFGRKDFSTKRTLFNDTESYKSANYETKASFGGLFYSAGIQYKANLTKTVSLTLGVYGNLEQKINASQDIIRETFTRDATTGDRTLDSVDYKKGVEGKITYPAQVGAGFVVEKLPSSKEAGWLLGVDFIQTKWTKYRFYSTTDAVKDNWEVRVGGQFRPAAKRNYFSNVSYRLGIFTGPDYIYVDSKELKQTGFTFGLGLPLANYNRQAPGQVTIINLALEYIKRGNNSNYVKENLFRVSVGLNLSDIWFQKRKYAD